MSDKLFKAVKTPHAPWSKNHGKEDRFHASMKHFEGKDVVVTEKLDGENTTLYPDYYHARSIDGRHHPSQAWIKQFHAGMRFNIPENFRVCGEYVYALHSIHYHNLPTYFFVFAIYNGETCLSWDETVEYAKMLGLETVPVLYRGIYDEARIREECYTGKSVFGKPSRWVKDVKHSPQEGYVIRVASEFSYEAASENLAKFVRKGHVQEDEEHWMTKPVVPNLLKRQECTLEECRDA